jgi:sigma-B regulation protein RsbU (phosphoserine phosphatase)
VIIINTIVVIGEYTKDTLILEDCFNVNNYSYYNFNSIDEMKKVPKFQIDIIFLLANDLLNNEILDNSLLLQNECECEIIVIIKEKNLNLINLLFENRITNFITFPLIKSEIREKIFRITEVNKKEEIITQFINKMNYLILITDIDEEIIYVNDEYVKETGYTKEELIGAKPSILKSGKHNYMYYDNLIQTLESGLIWKGTFNNKKKDGTLYLEDVAIYPIKIHGKIKYYAKIGANITDKEKIIEERKKETLIAIKTQKKLLSSDYKDEFISIKGGYYPLNDISGDIYKWYKYSDGKYIVFLGDVLEKGIGGALLTTAIITILDSIIAENTKLENIMEVLNNKIINTFSNEQKISGYSFTAIYLVIDTELKTIEYINCGHPNFYLINNKKIETLISSNSPIGVFENIEFKSKIINYSSNTQLLLYTNGITEISMDFANSVDVLETELSKYCNDNDNLLEILEVEILEHYFNKINDDISLISIKLI